MKYGKKTLKKGRDYTVAYRNNTSVGIATAKITGKGRYTGTRKVTFAIKPKKFNLSRVKAGKKRFTASWKSQGKQVSGYQLQYSLKSDFSGGKLVTVKGASKVSRTVKGLKSGLKYYVRIRAYRKSGKRTLYSAWSKTKSVTTG